MNKTISRCALIAATATWIILSLCSPSALSDKNTFLKGFVNHELLSFLGVLVTITLASAANLHLTLNRLEENVGARVFTATRSAVKRSAYWLIGTLPLTLAIVVAKPMLIGGGQATTESLVNGAGLLAILFSVLILIDLTDAAFSIGPTIHNE
jgi:hypothetical protein